jgi:hypothetical protein
MNQHSLEMQKAADIQRKDFEREIEKLRSTRVERPHSEPEISTSGGNSWTSNPLRPRKGISPILSASRPIIEEFDGNDKKFPHSFDADDEHFTAGPFKPPGLPGGGPPDDDESDDDGRGRKGKKGKKKEETQ